MKRYFNINAMTETLESKYIANPDEVIVLLDTHSFFTSDWLLADDSSPYGYVLSYEDGELIRKPYELSPTKIILLARQWRNVELDNADIEILKIDDVSGDTSLWRDYRCKLRDWPSTETFPDNGDRPVAPN
jgi:hypothetical protein